MVHGFVHDLLDHASAGRPDSVAVSDEAGSWTCAELREVSLRVAEWLLRRGIRRGDRVLTRLPNRRELVALLYGASRVGAVLVPVNPDMKPFHLTGVLADASPELVLAEDTGEVRSLTAAPLLGVDEAWQEIEQTEPHAGGAGPVTSHDIALLIYTSGSTSAPKAVVCPHRQVVFAAHSINDVLRYREDDVVFLRLPLSFDYGLYQIFLGALSGAQVVLAPAGHDTTLLRRLRAANATIVPVVPSLAQLLTHLTARDGSPTAVRMFTNTGAVLTEPLRAALRHGFPGARIVLMFGTTECKRISILAPDGDLTKPGSVGRPLPGTAVVVVDEDGKVQPPGQHGEFVVRGPHVMNGYWRAAELTEQRFRRDRDTGEVVLHTGDYGYLDEDGHLYFAGRQDDIVKRKGVRVGLTEIEAAAVDIPGVRAAAALVVDDGVLVLCVATTGTESDVIVRGLVERLEPAKIPDRCVTFDELPLTPNQKVDKKRLADAVRSTKA
ncbi:class I adenylate-forming enzyme family protein [Lentzea sp. NPDC102401]|uniref:class I adenylate-forming enzyme family protein n=1 Tax=Lentzea sp. NPDC102401 TaxID=3364128 RepID=UPI00380FE406